MLRRVMMAAAGSPPAPTMPVGLLWPCTYEIGNIDGYALTVSVPDGAKNTAAPTPEGALFDGLATRRLYTGLPSTLATRYGKKVICAAVRASMLPANQSLTGTPVIGLATSGEDGGGRLSLAVWPDEVRRTIPEFTLLLPDTQYPVSRQGWRFQGVYPELTVGGQQARPQCVEFLPDGTLLVSAHYNDTRSRVHRLSAPGSGEPTVLGWFDFPTPYVHVASCAVRPSDGSVWFGDYATGALLEVDVAASLATNAAVILSTYDCSAVVGAGAYCWGSVGGTEYLFAAEYVSTSNSAAPRLHVIPAGAVADGEVYSEPDAHRIYSWMFRCQGLAFVGGTLYASSNRDVDSLLTLGTSQPLAGWMLGLTVDLSVANGTQVVSLWDRVASYYGPSRYVEDLALSPDGRLWTSTEGHRSTGDSTGWLSLWSANLSGPIEMDEHTFVIEFEGVTSGASPVHVDIDGRRHRTFSANNLATPNVALIGGSHLSTPGWAGQQFRGYVRSALMSWSRPSDAQLAALWAGAYDTRSLSRAQLAITNPGAEDGLAGWTVEVGGLVQRMVSPPPHSGAAYFSGGSVARSRSRQAIGSVPAPDAAVDAGNAWAIVRWWQAGSAGDGSPGDRAMVGARALSATSTVLAENPDTVAAWVGNDEVWYQRSAHLPLPPGSRSLQLFIDTIRQAGTVLQGNVDDITAEVLWR